MRQTFERFFLTVSVLSVLIILSLGCTGLMPKAKTTPSEGPTIDEAQKEDAMGLKARITVTRFVDKSAKGPYSGRIGDGMAEMLANALFATDRFIILERQSVDDALKEQDFGASGRVKPETAPRIGEIEGADILVEGTICEFEPDAKGFGGGVGGPLTRKRRIPFTGDVSGDVKVAHVAVIVKMIDAKTSRRIASEQVEGTAADVSGGVKVQGPVLSAGLGAYKNTPMEKAIRISINEAVKSIVAKTPKSYYRYSDTPPPTPAFTAPPAASTAPVTTGSPKPATGTASPSPPVTPQATPPPSASPQQIPTVSPQPPSTPARVIWASVNLREGPGPNYKIVGNIKKGTSLAILEEKGKWARVQLEGGEEAWVWKPALSIGP